MIIYELLTNNVIASIMSPLSYNVTRKLNSDIIGNGYASLRSTLYQVTGEKYRGETGFACQDVKGPQNKRTLELRVSG